MGASELNADARAAQSVDRLAVKALGGLVAAEQRPRAGLDTECPVGATCSSLVRESLQGFGGSLGLAIADGGLDQFHQPPRRVQQLKRVCAGLLRRGQRLLVSAEAVVEQRARPVDDGRSCSLAAGHHLVHAGVDQL